MKKRKEIVDISFKLTLKIIKLSKWLETNKKYVIASQLLQSGTLLYENIREFQNAHGRKGFTVKCVNAAKETKETEYWQLPGKKNKNYPNRPDLMLNTQAIIRLLSKIISSSIKNENHEKYIAQ